MEQPTYRFSFYTNAVGARLNARRHSEVTSCWDRPIYRLLCRDVETRDQEELGRVRRAAVTITMSGTQRLCTGCNPFSGPLTQPLWLVWTIEQDLPIIYCRPIYDFVPGIPYWSTASFGRTLFLFTDGYLNSIAVTVRGKREHYDKYAMEQKLIDFAGIVNEQRLQVKVTLFVHKTKIVRL